MSPGRRQGADDPSSSGGNTPNAAAGELQAAGLRPVTTGNAYVASGAFLTDSPGPGSPASPQVLGSFAFGAQQQRPSTADTNGGYG